jgi:BMFP domain-containing protein YqiC
MANVQRKRSNRPELLRSPSKRSRDGTTKNRIASKEVVHQFLRGSRSSSNLARQGQETTDTLISEERFVVGFRPTEDESVSDTLAVMSVLSESENSQNVVEPRTFSSIATVTTNRSAATEADPGTPRTPRLASHPAGLNDCLQRVPSVVFRYDPERVSVASSKPSGEDRTLNTGVENEIMCAAGNDVDVIESFAAATGKMTTKKKRFKLRKSLRNFRRRLVKRQPKDGENLTSFESQNTVAETFLETAGAESQSVQMRDSMSSQDSSVQPVYEKKKPGMIQRFSAWLVGKKPESEPLLQKTLDNEEQVFHRTPSYRKAIDTGRWSSVYVNGSSTDDEASEDDDDLGEFSQEILADSAQDPEEIKTVKEKIVNGLEKMGKEIEQRFKDQLNDTVKKLDISSSLQYSVFSKVAGALIEGGQMTRDRLMKLLVFGRQLVTGVPQDLATMMEQYTSQAVEDYASDFIRDNGGWVSPMYLTISNSLSVIS